MARLGHYLSSPLPVVGWVVVVCGGCNSRFSGFAALVFLERPMGVLFTSQNFSKVALAFSDSSNLMNVEVGVFPST